MKFDFNDIVIEPKYMSSISSRKEIDIFTGKYPDISLPLFVSPMDTVINNDNCRHFMKLKMKVCVTRGSTHDPYLSDIFTSYSLDEFIQIMDDCISKNRPNCVKEVADTPTDILIDIANGHMEKLYDAVKKYKEHFKYKKLMVGNVANPNTYRLLAEAGADYIRVGIGNGAGCLTTQQTGVGYPMASLIQECYRIKVGANLDTKIVADGGFKTYSDIIKALALGADYVMLGSMLNKALESAGDMYWKGIKLNRKLANFLYGKGFKIQKKYRGMSTKEVQKKWGNTKLKTSEGVTRYFNVEYTLEQWTQNFTDYLKSAMSYTDSRTIEEFKGKVNINLITNEAYKRFNK